MYLILQTHASACLQFLLHVLATTEGATTVEECSAHGLCQRLSLSPLLTH